MRRETTGSATRDAGAVRTALFVPGHRDDYFEQALSGPSDAVILDLEDAVPTGAKVRARSLIREALRKMEEPSGRPRVWVRMNVLGSPAWDLDAKALVGLPALDGLMPTKTNGSRSPEAVVRAWKRVAGKAPPPLWPLIETVEGLHDLMTGQMRGVREYCDGITYGGEDFVTSMRTQHSAHGQDLTFVRAWIVLLARVHGVTALDTPFLRVEDPTGLREAAVTAAKIGFDGKLLVHPRQVDTVNEVFTPTRSEIERAERLLQVASEQEAGEKTVTVLDGELVGPPMVKRARSLIAQATRLGVLGKHAEDETSEKPRQGEKK